MWHDFNRWEKLVKKCRKLGVPNTVEEYRKVHKMFVKTSKKCDDWCYAVGAFDDDVYPIKLVEECKGKDIERIWDTFIGRMDYFSDRMGWGRWLELTAYLGMMEEIIFKKDREQRYGKQ